MALHLCYRWRSSQYAVTHVRNNIQGRIPNAVKWIFPYHKKLLLKDEFAPSGSEFFPLREVPIFKEEAIEENPAVSI